MYIYSHSIYHMISDVMPHRAADIRMNGPNRFDAPIGKFLFKVQLPPRGCLLKVAALRSASDERDHTSERTNYTEN